MYYTFKFFKIMPCNRRVLNEKGKSITEAVHFESS